MTTITITYEYGRWWTVVNFGDMAAQMSTVTRPTQRTVRKFKKYAYEPKRYANWCALI